MLRLPRWDEVSEMAEAANRRLEYEINRELDLINREIQVIRQTAELSLSGRVIPVEDFGAVYSSGGTPAGSVPENVQNHIELFGSKRIQATLRMTGVTGPGATGRKNLFVINEAFRPALPITGMVGGFCVVGSSYYPISGYINSNTDPVQGNVMVIFTQEAVNAENIRVFLMLDYEIN